MSGLVFVVLIAAAAYEVAECFRFDRKNGQAKEVGE